MGGCALIGAVPGALVGALVDALPGSLVDPVVDALVDALPDSLVGPLVDALPGSLPGSLVGSLPGSLPGAVPGAVVGALVDALLGALLRAPANRRGRGERRGKMVAYGYRLTAIGYLGQPRMRPHCLISLLSPAKLKTSRFRPSARRFNDLAIEPVSRAPLHPVLPPVLG